jgi:hypothetical protein
MAVTGACAEVIYLSGSEQPDYDRPVPSEEIVDSVEERLKPLADSERIDEPVSPRNAFGI